MFASFEFPFERATGSCPFCFFVALLAFLKIYIDLGGRGVGEGGTDTSCISSDRGLCFYETETFKIAAKVHWYTRGRVCKHFTSETFDSYELYFKLVNV